MCESEKKTVPMLTLLSFSAKCLPSYTEPNLWECSGRVRADHKYAGLFLASSWSLGSSISRKATDAFSTQPFNHHTVRINTVQMSEERGGVLAGVCGCGCFGIPSPFYTSSSSLLPHPQAGCQSVYHAVHCNADLRLVLRCVCIKKNGMMCEYAITNGQKMYLIISDTFPGFQNTCLESV